MAELVSNRYSAAFFDLGQSSDKLEVFATDARLVLEILAGEQTAGVDAQANLGGFLYHPQISEDSKIGVVESVLSGKVCDETLGLVAILIKKQRERELPQVLEAFLKMIDDHNELAEAHITSAVPIDDERLETIRGILSEKFGKKVVLRTSVDADLIGGFKVLILGNSFDRTIKTTISELTSSIS
jgi:F-type H+-transporting ATPase subunit delta